MPRSKLPEVDALVAALLRAPRGEASRDELEALAELEPDPIRWLDTEEIRAALGDSPTPRLAG